VAVVPEQAVDAEAARPASGTPGVDLGALQSLVGDCAGHLWMATEPSGDLVIKIHLPRRALDRAEPHPTATRPILARWVDRLSGARP
jgi:hypothetical protein